MDGPLPVFLCGPCDLRINTAAVLRPAGRRGDFAANKATYSL